VKNARILTHSPFGSNVHGTTVICSVHG